MNREFRPRYGIVTASDSGIGAATAVALATAGLDVGGMLQMGPQAGSHLTDDQWRDG